MGSFGTCQFSNAEIQKLFITKWSADVITYFNTGSTVTSLTGMTENWQEIEIHTVTASYNQSMNEPNENGINYTESVDILIPHSDITKWLDLINILTDRYIIVFQDGNNNWYIMGWRFGTKVENYNLEGNQYNLSFLNNFSTTLLTAINESYVTSNIL